MSPVITAVLSHALGGLPWASRDKGPARDEPAADLRNVHRLQYMQSCVASRGSNTACLAILPRQVTSHSQDDGQQAWQAKPLQTQPHLWPWQLDAPIDDR